MTKVELRKLYLANRSAMSASELDAASRAIADRFFSEVDLSGVSRLHTFIRMGHTHELDTSNIYFRIWRDHPEISTYAPRIEIGSAEMESVLFHSATELVENAWRVREPVGDETAQPDEFDAVLVPLLAFDPRGHRVGYGKGYYDRFLTACRPDCVKIGLSAFPAETNFADVGPHDVTLDMCLTPQETFRFK